MHALGPSPARGSPIRGVGRAVALLLLTSVGYFVFARLGYACPLGHTGILILWPPSGLMLAILLRLPRRDWAVALVGGFLGNLAADLGNGLSVAQTLAGPAANALEIVAAASLLRVVVGSGLTLTRLRHVGALVLGAAVGSNAVTALVGAWALGHVHGRYWASWFVWWAGDGMGMLIVAPLILSWAAFGNSRPDALDLRWRRLLEGTVLAIAVAVLGQVVLGQRLDAGRPFTVDPYVLLPLLLWAAVRFGPMGATTTMGAVTALTLWNAAHAVGPFAELGRSPRGEAWAVYVFLALGSLTSLTVAAMLRERQAAEAEASERARQAAFVADVAVTLTESAPLAETLTRCADAIVQHVHVVAAGIWTINEDATSFELRASSGAAPAAWREQAPVSVSSDSAIATVARTRQPLVTHDTAIVTNGQAVEPEARAVTVAGYPMVLGGETVGVIGVASLAPLATQAEESLASIARGIALGIRRTALEVSRQRLADILEAAADFVTIGQKTGSPLYVNAAARRALEIGPTERIASLFAHRPEGFAATFRDTILPALERDGIWSGETEYLSRGGRLIPVSQVTVAHRDASGRFSLLSTISRDITDRRALEEELRQSQKMEGIGQLAGGIAHDFNNLLTAILGYAELLAGSLPASDLRRRDVDEIKKAGTRAAVLTRQLLAFSRKQILAPRVLQVCTVVDDVMPMLRRLLGESIDLRTVFHNAGLGKVDAGQLGQVLINLAVNARDAMPGGGRLTIDTADVEVGAGFGEPHAGVPAGRYVRLAVSDTGHGMDDAIKGRIFDPFFTTKPVGQGTGLGLATVHGIVKQSGGYVWVSSEVGHGATFTVLLPRVTDVADRDPAPDLTLILPSRSGTVLVVEDESLIRAFVEKVLTTQGYVVHAFGAPSAALAFAESHREPIDVVLTDVILPEMDGRGLSLQLIAAHPEASVVYMSGYTETGIVRDGVLDAGTRFLQKPFSARSLLERIGEVSPPGPADAPDQMATERAATH